MTTTEKLMRQWSQRNWPVLAHTVFDGKGSWRQLHS